MKKSRSTERLQKENGQRMRQMANHLIAEAIDANRDREMSEPVVRPISDSEVNDLADLLVGTDDSVPIGLSLLGIDPLEFDESDIVSLTEELNEKGIRFDEDEEVWVRE